MTLTFTEARIQMDSGVWLCLKVNEPAPARTFILDKQNRIYDCEIKEHREKRSLDANAYCWVLLDKLADAIRSTKEEIYLQKVREIGIFRDFILEAAAVKTFRTVWERQGTGWPTEIVDYSRSGDRQVVRAYYGSSQYNTKQMSRLIDSIVQDCKDLGIETLPPEKLGGHEGGVGPCINRPSKQPYQPVSRPLWPRGTAPTAPQPVSSAALREAPTVMWYAAPRAAWGWWRTSLPCAAPATTLSTRGCLWIGCGLWDSIPRRTSGHTSSTISEAFILTGPRRK